MVFFNKALEEPDQNRTVEIMTEENMTIQRVFKIFNEVFSFI